MTTSFRSQASKLLEGGYSGNLLVGVAEGLLRRVRNPEVVVGRKSTQKPVVVPHIHKVVHRLKKVAQRHNVPVVF